MVKTRKIHYRSQNVHMSYTQNRLSWL